MLPAEHYELQPICPHCDKHVTPNDAFCAVGFVWHTRCYAEFTVEYGSWLNRISNPPNFGDDIEDLARSENRDKDAYAYHLQNRR